MRRKQTFKMFLTFYLIQKTEIAPIALYAVLSLFSGPFERTPEPGIMSRLCGVMPLPQNTPQQTREQILKPDLLSPMLLCY